MNKAESGVESAGKGLNELCLSKTAVSKDNRRLNDGDDSEDSDFDIDDDEDDELTEAQEVKALFSDKIFNKAEDVFKYEAETSGFNLLSVVNNYCMGMFDYIKMINYIRKEVFRKKYENDAAMPWNNELYMKTEIEDDVLLQFDVEEDLDLLEFKAEINNNKTDGSSLAGDNNEELRFYKNKFRESQARVEELVDVTDKLRKFANNLLTKSTATDEKNESKPANESDSEASDDDSVYINSYSNYSIHLEMLQDKVRTEGYMNAILKNPEVFKDKVVLDVGCGSGILSLFAAKAGAKMVIAVDMSDIIDNAIRIAKENNFGEKIVFLKGKMEEVKLPVDKVDIIISEWMGYFLLFESMLDSVLYARDKYLQPETGIVLPNYFDMHLFGVCDEQTHDDKIKFWSDVYGFKMSCMRKLVVNDAQVLTLEPEHVVTDLFQFKEIDCMTCTVADVAKFQKEFVLNVEKDTVLTGIAASFDTYFNHSQLGYKSSFSTSPFHKTTHWQQTLLQLEEPVNVKKDTQIKGKIKCYKNPDYLRGYLIELIMFDRIFKYKVD